MRGAQSVAILSLAHFRKEGTRKLRRILAGVSAAGLAVGGALCGGSILSRGDRTPKALASVSTQCEAFRQSDAARSAAFASHRQELQGLAASQPDKVLDYNFSFTAPKQLSDVLFNTDSASISRLVAGFAYSQGTRAVSTMEMLPNRSFEESIDLWKRSMLSSIDQGLANSQQPDKAAIQTAKEQLQSGSVPVWAIGIKGRAGDLADYANSNSNSIFFQGEGGNGSAPPLPDEAVTAAARARACNG